MVHTATMSKWSLQINSTARSLMTTLLCPIETGDKTPDVWARYCINEAFACVFQFICFFWLWHCTRQFLKRLSRDKDTEGFLSVCFSAVFRQTLCAMRPHFLKEKWQLRSHPPAMLSNIQNRCRQDGSTGVLRERLVGKDNVECALWDDAGTWP